ncbi:sodium- and chloride-dependent taurine transporter-like isoform X2 [Liolophura sinensis]
MSRGAIKAWKISPLFQGVGFSMTALNVFSQCYYNVVLAWVLYYLFSSFTTRLPWSHCGNDWNSDRCIERCGSYNRTDNNTFEGTASDDAITNRTSKYCSMLYSGLLPNYTANNSQVFMDPATEFWERKVLGVTEGIEHSGSVKWDLALCLLLAWLMVYFCIWKGVKLTGKITYVTVTTPYLLLFALLVRGVTLESASLGINYYLLPDWSKLAKVQVWLEAGIQVFYSYGVGLTIHTSLGSCNRFHHNSLRHILIFACLNSATSFISGFVIFSVLGFMANKQGLSVDKVAGSGPGLAFVAYPEAMSQMPAAPVWSVVFFLTLILLGIDSQFAHCEGFIVSVTDLFPKYLRGTPRKEIFIAVLCTSWFLVGLSMVTEGGVYVQQIFEWYCGGRILLLMVFLQCIGIAYFYGINKFQQNIEYMLGYRVGPFFKIAWLFASPLFSILLFILDIVLYPEMTYKRKSGVYYFPDWARGVGWLMSGIPLLFIPGVAIWRLMHTGGGITKRIRFLCKPQFDDTQMSRSLRRIGESKPDDEVELSTLTTKS